MKYIEDSAFISIDQFVYLKRHSTQTRLHRVIDDWPGPYLLDISKWFDSINYIMLLKS